MPRLALIAFLLTGGAVSAAAMGLKNPFAAASGPTGPAISTPAVNLDSDLIKNPFAAASGPTGPAISTPAANLDSDLKDPFAAAGATSTELKNPGNRPGELRDPFALRSAAEPPAGPAPDPVVHDGVIDPWASRSASGQPAAAEPATPVSRSVHGLVDPWGRPQHSAGAGRPVPDSDLKNPFEAAPAGTGLVDPGARTPTERPRRPAR